MPHNNPGFDFLIAENGKVVRYVDNYAFGGVMDVEREEQITDMESPKNIAKF